MKKVFTKEIIEKNNNLIVFILIILSLIGIAFNVLVINSDELWNFQNNYKIYNGFEMYNEVNIILTPLIYILGNSIFKILGANFLSYRILNILMNVILFFMIYIILKKLEFRKRTSLIITMLLLSAFYWIIIVGMNYNPLILVFWIFGIYFYLKNKKYNSIIQTIIWFLIYFTKQNMAVFYGISLVICEIIKKEDIRTKIKNLTIEIIGFVFLVLISLGVMKINNILDGFISFSVLGIREFALENLSINWKALMYVVVINMANLILSINLIKSKTLNVNEEYQLKILNAFAYPLLFMAFPIVNRYHLIIGNYVAVILLLFLIQKLTKELKIKEKFINVCLFIVVVGSLGNSVYHFVSWKSEFEEFSVRYNIEKSNPYYGALFKEGRFENIKIVTNYIKNNTSKVIIFSGKSAFYNIPLKINNGILDFPFLGNLGKYGEEGIINELKKLENTEILIEKDEKELIDQESLKARKYIKENFEKIGELEEFEIYYSK